MNNFISINEDRILEVVDGGNDSDFYKVLYYEPINNLYIVSELFLSEDIDIAEVLPKMMSKLSDEIYSYIINLIYKKRDAIILCYFEDDDIITKVFNVEISEETISLDDIDEYVISLEIDWSKIRYNHAEIYIDRIERVIIETDKKG